MEKRVIAVIVCLGRRWNSMRFPWNGLLLLLCIVQGFMTPSMGFKGLNDERVDWDMTVGITFINGKK